MSQGLVEIEQFVATKTGKTLATSKVEIDSAIKGALDEFGANIEVAFAQDRRPYTIAANANSILLPQGFSQLKSIVLNYGSESVDLGKKGKSPADFDAANIGLETNPSDYFDMFMVSGSKMFFGPGLAKTAMTVLIRAQRELTFDDIMALGNPMVIAHGAVSNLLPLDHPSYPTERGIFLAAIRPAEKAQATVSVTSKDVDLPPFIRARINEINEL
jgi:hypothetical protein